MPVLVNNLTVTREDTKSQDRGPARESRKDFNMESKTTNQQPKPVLLRPVKPKIEPYKEPKVYCPSCCEYVDPIDDFCPNEWCGWGLR